MPQPWPEVSPDQTNDTERRSPGAVRKCPPCASLCDRRGEVFEPHAVENILPGRQTFEQHL